MTLFEAACEFAETYAHHAGLNYAVAPDGDFVFMIFWNSKLYMNTGLCAIGTDWAKARLEIADELDKYWRHLNEES